MKGLRGWIIFGWIALPTVMYGGYSLIALIKLGNILTPEQVGFFRAGHAQAGVLTLMSLLYHTFLDRGTRGFAIMSRFRTANHGPGRLAAEPWPRAVRGGIPRKRDQ